MTSGFVGLLLSLVLLGINTMENKFITLALIAYIADYVNEEITRGATIDKYTITDAIDAFNGGAGDTD